MITLTRAGVPLSGRYRAAPDGFAWWYLDLVDDEGNGVVVICSFALPFVPSTGRHASINLAVYERGRSAWYGLCEVSDARVDVGGPGSEAAAGSDETLTFGTSCIVVRRRAGRVTVEAWLDVCVPGVAVAHGLVVVDGVARAPDEEDTPDDDPSVVHAWSPQTGPARGSARLMLDGKEMHIEGRGYHDRNGSLTPLGALGIRRWMWGRVSQPHEERIVYALWPAGDGAPLVLGLVIDAAGRTTRVPHLRVDVDDGSTHFGMFDARGLRVVDEKGAVFIDGRRTATLERGPFYVRGLWRSGGATGFYEDVAPARIGLPAHRPLVAMRVAVGPAPWSWWLPLFCGSAHNRLRRLILWWWRRASRS